MHTYQFQEHKRSVYKPLLTDKNTLCINSSITTNLYLAGHQSHMKLIRYAVTPIRARCPLSRDKIRTCNLSHLAETSLRRFNNNFAVAVACSTVTVTKCQAALRTLQAFTYFRPTCLCREPHVDPDCNSFQNFLFDHPCDYVEWKGKNLHIRETKSILIVNYMRALRKIV